MTIKKPKKLICKTFLVKSKILKCSHLENNKTIHSHYCLKKQELENKYKDGKVVWNAQEQIWSISFNYLPSSSKKSNLPEAENNSQAEISTTETNETLISNE